MVADAGGTVTVETTLPMPSISFLHLTPADPATLAG